MKIIYNQLISYINDNDIICKQQSGFRPNHSTETALLNCTDPWLCNMDKRLVNGVLFLDLKKAFDTVNHSILLKKLHQYGVRGIPLKLLASNLNNRKQICVINNFKSEQETVTYGVPQGSNLGPFAIFIVYKLFTSVPQIHTASICLPTTLIYHAQEKPQPKLSIN